MKSHHVQVSDTWREPAAGGSGVGYRARRTGTRSPPRFPARAATPCTCLTGLRIPAAAITLPTSGGEADSATTKSTTSAGTNRGYCDAQASFPGFRAAPETKMKAWLPVGRNRHTVMFGGCDGRFRSGVRGPAPPWTGGSA